MQTAIVITAAGSPEVLQPRQLAVPVARDTELLIEVRFAGVNRHDCNQRRRGPTPAHSDIPGLEVSGTVRALGAAVRGWSVGQRVCALVDGGGYAQFAVAPADHAFALADAISWQDAAALPEAMFTLWHNFFGIARLAAGETVLIHGGTSGVGSLAIQVLQQLGHTVYTTCGSDEKCAQARALGAVAFNYRESAFEDDVMRCTAGRGVDVILDMAGGEYGARNVAALAARGRLLHLSPGDGAEFRAPLRDIMAKQATVTGSLLRPLPAADKTLIARELRRVVLPMVCAGAVRPLIGQVLPLTQAAQAHRLLESGTVAGKLLLDPS